jgi:plasmid stabilization system protein ParE
MAKRKIVWSNRAKIRLYAILDFYVVRNKSKVYSNKLQKLISKEVNLLLKQPDLGLKTSEDTTRGLIIGNYIVYYEIPMKRSFFIQSGTVDKTLTIR